LSAHSYFYCWNPIQQHFGTMFLWLYKLNFAEKKKKKIYFFPFSCKVFPSPFFFQKTKLFCWRLKFFFFDQPRLIFFFYFQV
jgi:hypothetical protein